MGAGVAISCKIGDGDGVALLKLEQGVVQGAGTVFGDLSSGGSPDLGGRHLFGVAAQAIERHELRGSFSIRHGDLLSVYF